MKRKWLVADITAVGPPDRAERAILGVILAGWELFLLVQAISRRCLGQFRPYLWLRSRFVV